MWYAPGGLLGPRVRNGVYMALSVPENLVWILGGVVALFVVIFIVRRMMRLMLVAILLALLVAVWLLIRHGGFDRLTKASWWPW